MLSSYTDHNSQFSIEKDIGKIKDAELRKDWHLLIYLFL